MQGVTRAGLWAVLLLPALPLTEASAEAAGWYLGGGVSVATYRVSTRLDSDLAGSRTFGWRLEGGHTWDPGRSRGFQLGIAATFDQWNETEQTNEVSGRGELTSKASIRALSISFLLQQEVAKWVDFVFKIGPTYGGLEAEEFVRYSDGSNYQDEFSREGWGGQYVAGLLFFLPRDFAIEVAAQGNWFLLDGYFDAAAVGALSTSVQYRF